MRFHFHPHMHFRDWAERRHRTPPAQGFTPTHAHSHVDDTEVAKATAYVSAVTLVVLLVVLAAIAFGQEAMHWLGVS